MRILAVLFLVVIAAAATTLNKDYPKDIFRMPVNFTPRLSGTFGELRPNHFHAGIDIKSPNGGVGAPILAAASGTVRRIKRSAYGYGNALYIDHPMGYTTVYAHLHSFSKEIEDYVKEQQYARQSFEVDIEVSSGTFNFEQGELVGKLGNSGRSFGPHLHFEIRDRTTEIPINPLLFGLKVKDSRAPRLHQLRVYALNSQRKELYYKTKNIKKGKYGWYIGSDTITINADHIGLASKVYDHLDGAHNWNGIYKQELYVDDALKATFEMEKISFDETRYINAHMDYKDRLENKSYFNKMYRMPGNKLGIYKLSDDGVLELNAKPLNCRLVAYDLEGNTSEVSFVIKKGTEPLPSGQPYNYLLKQGEENMIQRSDIEMYFKEDAFYEPIEMYYKMMVDPSDGVYSHMHHIHEHTTPVHSYFDLKIKPSRTIPDSLRSKAFIANCTGGATENYGGTWENGFLKTKSRDFGNFCIMTDNIPPTIKPVKFGRNMTQNNYISFKIGDNIETAGHVDGLRYDAYIDGRWILMTFDSRTNIITHRFDEKTTAGEHILKIVLQDGVGNQTVYEQKFVR